MDKLLVSACLLGTPCRYDGKSKPIAGMERLRERYELVPVCPECAGGLPTPRMPSERCGDRVIMRGGADVTAQYQRGAQYALELCRKEGCAAALLKERSPSCGSGEIYDGTFTHTLIPGNGVTAELLKKNGIKVCGESELGKL
ncbi:MAG: DUF523 domain-containing protein [Eubacteriales bacterium]|nr:DUF523 domain-containing protein [Eubacteriales bacterium]